MHMVQCGDVAHIAQIDDAELTCRTLAHGQRVKALHPCRLADGLPYDMFRTAVPVIIKGAMAHLQGDRTVLSQCRRIADDHTAFLQGACGLLGIRETRHAHRIGGHDDHAGIHVDHGKACVSDRLVRFGPVHAVWRTVRVEGGCHILPILLPFVHLAVQFGGGKRLDGRVLCVDVVVCLARQVHRGFRIRLSQGIDRLVVFERCGIAQLTYAVGNHHAIGIVVHRHLRGQNHMGLTVHKFHAPIVGQSRADQHHGIGGQCHGQHDRDGGRYEPAMVFRRITQTRSYGQGQTSTDRTIYDDKAFHQPHQANHGQHDGGDQQHQGCS